MPRIIGEPGPLAALPDAVNSLSAAGAVVIVDEAIARVGYAGAVVAALRGTTVVQHILAPGEPTVASVNAAADVVRSLPGAVVIGIGGGSALDTAKQAAVVAMGDESVLAYALCAQPFPGRRPIIAIPTTSGTGAEVTRTCILSDADGRKLWTWGDEMLPDVVLLDPTAAASMPPYITAATGLDAFVHALEACSGQRRRELPPGAAIEALRLVVRHLPAAVANGSDLVARRGMQQAALMAGTAIDHCGTGIAHAIGHALGSLHHVPHGIAVAIGLDASIDWNVDGAPDAFASAAEAFDTFPADVPAVLRELFVTTHFASAFDRLPDVALDAATIAGMMVSVENQPMVDNNCRVPDARDRRDLAERTVDSWKRLRSAQVGR
ncbi:MAG: iron-containing alcohol dehydrogenase [Ilumatobacteraceae bacterium]